MEPTWPSLWVDQEPSASAVCRTNKDSDKKSRTAKTGHPRLPCLNLFVLRVRGESFRQPLPALRELCRPLIWKQVSEADPSPRRASVDEFVSENEAF